ncbi:MAG: DUF5615 family PIN-like protein [Chloroflexota bacterium]
MAGLRYLADMNLSPLTVEMLRSDGLDVFRVSDVLPASAPDEDVLAMARGEGRVLITQDLDFSALVALGGHAEPSLVTMRLSTSEPEVVTRRLQGLLSQIEEELRQGCAVTIDDDTVRIRKLPIS